MQCSPTSRRALRKARLLQRPEPVRHLGAEGSDAPVQENCQNHDDVQELKNHWEVKEHKLPLLRLTKRKFPELLRKWHAHGRHVSKIAWSPSMSSWTQPAARYDLICPTNAMSGCETGTAHARSPTFSIIHALCTTVRFAIHPGAASERIIQESPEGCFYIFLIKPRVHRNSDNGRLG